MRTDIARILIIDDDAIFSTQLSSYIEDMGLRWQRAGSLREGLDQAENNAYDIVFLDIFLPDGSGLDGISILKQCTSSPEVLIITGKGDPNGAEIALKNGAWHYIEKPASYHLIELLVTRGPGLPEKKEAVLSSDGIQPGFRHRRRSQIAGGAGSGAKGCANRRQRADYRRNWHRQGRIRPDASFKRPSQEQADGDCGLHEHHADIGFQSFVRAQEGGLHRGGPGPGGIDQASRRGDDFSRRGRRPSVGDPKSASACPSAQDVSSIGRQGRDTVRVPRRIRDQPGFAGRHRKGQVQAGPVFFDWRRFESICRRFEREKAT